MGGRRGFQIAIWRRFNSWWFETRAFTSGKWIEILLRARCARSLCGVFGLSASVPSGCPHPSLRAVHIRPFGLSASVRSAQSLASASEHRSFGISAGVSFQLLCCASLGLFFGSSLGLFLAPMPQFFRVFGSLSLSRFFSSKTLRKNSLLYPLNSPIWTSKTNQAEKNKLFWRKSSRFPSVESKITRE